MEVQTRHAVPKAWPPPTKFRAEIWGVGQVVVPYGGREFRSFDLWFSNIPAGRFPADAGVGPFLPCREVPAFPLPSGRDGGVAVSRAAAAL